MDPNPAHLPVSPYPPLTPTACFPKNKTDNKTDKKKTHLALLSVQHLFILVALCAAVCHIIYPIVQSAPPIKCSLQLVTGLGQGLWHLIITGPHQNSSHISCCCPSHGDLVALILQDQFLHTLQQVTDVIDVRVGQSEGQNVGPGGS